MQSRIHDDRLKEMLRGNYLFELWYEGELLYQKPLKNKVRAWNQTRQDSSIVFLLDKEDEEEEGSFIHIVSLNNTSPDSLLDTDFHRTTTSKLNSIDERKIVDWTSLCDDEEAVKEINF